MTQEPEKTMTAEEYLARQRAMIREMVEDVTKEASEEEKQAHLRDYFAAAALPMMSDYAAGMAAVKAYEYADAMLKARQS